MMRKSIKMLNYLYSVPNQINSKLKGENIPEKLFGKENTFDVLIN